MTQWNWVRGTDRRLFDVGILADGGLHNPNGYPEDEVRAAIAAAEERQHQRRSRAAKKAAETRKERQELHVYRIARALLNGSRIGPRPRCARCDRRLTDAVSIDRGIGSECWDDVLATIEEEENRPETKTVGEDAV